MNILADKTIPLLDSLFQQHFEVTLYDLQKPWPKPTGKPSILICRSTLTVDENLIKRYNIQCVATASSGTNHINLSTLAKYNIPLFDAKGSNAQAVADYVLAIIAYLNLYAPLQGKRAGIIGMGFVGTLVSKYLHLLGFEIYCYDPLLKLKNNNFAACDFSELSSCDLLCIHANLHNTQPFSSYSLINENFFKQLQKPIVIINAARGGIVNEVDLLNAPKSVRYCTDVYENEPNINADIIERATLCTPHIAGHTVEAKQDAIRMLSKNLHAYYGLPRVVDVSTHTPPQQLNINLPWEETILNWYTPWHETCALKTPENKSMAFLSTRKDHQSCMALPFTLVDNDHKNGINPNANKTDN